MPAAVHFGGDLNWGREEEKSLRGHARRSERKAKRKAMAEANQKQRRCVLDTILNKQYHGAVLELFETTGWAEHVFDSMIKQAQINTERCRTKSEQLSEFREAWPDMTPEGQATFEEYFEPLGPLFQRKFTLADTSSEDEEKAQAVKTKFGNKFSVNETEVFARHPAGIIVVQNNRENFTGWKPIYKRGSKRGSKEAAAQKQGSAKDDEDSKQEAAAQKQGSAKGDGDSKRKASAAVLQGESSEEDVGVQKKVPANNSSKRRRIFEDESE